MGVVRGCGERVPGGIYCCTKLSPDGKPVEYFLLDPPIKLDTISLGLSPKGVRLIEKDGVYHILDWIGTRFYKNVADFIEEVRNFGLSRRLSSKLDFSLLTHQSRIIVAHERAYIENAAQYESEAPCVRHKPEHEPSDVMCGRLWWEDITGGTDEGIGPEVEDLRAVVRNMPSFSYVGKRAPDKVKPKYAVAAFASFPIHGLEVVRDPDGGRHDKAAEAARKARLDVSLVDE